jgi:mRNA-degrading endonuclease toxin of MazEF toxin-antitoxin module
MTPYKRGDVVLVAFPYADLQRWGQRPALIVQDENVQTELGHFVLAQITTTHRGGRTRVQIARDSAEGQTMHLLHDSVIVIDMLQSVERDLIQKRIGSCPCMEQVDQALRLLLRL